ncbi:YceI family protein [Streptomyces sp. J2-1]|uniref:YceI family protein n=1 Tax=Streptomyces corallincola TaxID=2851888 RepID=UPI001C37E78B|nr:YceI family protein [Streptomyces corallincola]MBV2353969.1 YceI family protein [Streptomyces corallincola]
MSSPQNFVPEPDTALAAQRDWYVDPWHTGVHFTVRNRGLGLVRGRFLRVSGTAEVPDGDLAKTAVSVTLETASLTTGVKARDANLRGSLYLDTEKHPTATFVSTELVRTGALHGVLRGTLELLGTRHDLDLEVRWLGRGGDPFREDGSQLAFTASGRLSLRELGLGQKLLPYLPIPGLGDAVELVLDVVLLPYDPTPMLGDIPID